MENNSAGEKVKKERKDKILFKSSILFMDNKHYIFIVSMAANKFNLFSTLEAICCRHQSCKGESKTNTV